MSGGVDSSVTAALMMEAGYDCIGANMRLFADGEAAAREKSCCSIADAMDARAVADGMGMPFYVLHYTEEFRRMVVEKFVRAYQNGITPNPCIDCNRYLKFDLLLEQAKAHGCDTIATGHYARIRFNEDSGRYELLKGIDAARDQSYVLYMLTQEELAHTRFPLGDLHKSEVRALAAEYGFVNAAKKDSQDICFVPDGDHARFIESYTGEKAVPGNFVDKEGTVLGQHKGIIRYTTGQRKGLGIASDRPYFITDILPETNEIVLGRKEDIRESRLIAEEFNWLSIDTPKEELRATAKIRYRFKEAACTARVLDGGSVEVCFDAPQPAITAGQAVVLYDGDRVLGGGTITRRASDKSTFSMS